MGNINFNKKVSKVIKKCPPFTFVIIAIQLNLYADLVIGTGLYLPSTTSGTTYFTDGSQASFAYPTSIALHANIDYDLMLLGGFGLGIGSTLNTTGSFELPKHHNWLLIPYYGRMVIGVEDGLSFFLNVGSTTHKGYYMATGGMGKHLAFDFGFCVYNFSDRMTNSNMTNYSIGYTASYNWRLMKFNEQDEFSQGAVLIYITALVVASLGWVFALPNFGH